MVVSYSYKITGHFEKLLLCCFASLLIEDRSVKLN